MPPEKSPFDHRRFHVPFHLLRATTSRARLWKSQGRHQEAVEVLTAFYGSFKEEARTPDLVDAQELLVTLS